MPLSLLLGSTTLPAFLLHSSYKKPQSLTSQLSILPIPIASLQANFCLFWSAIFLCTLAIMTRVLTEWTALDYNSIYPGMLTAHLVHLLCNPTAAKSLVLNHCYDDFSAAQRQSTRIEASIALCQNEIIHCLFFSCAVWQPRKTFWREQSLKFSLHAEDAHYVNMVGLLLSHELRI